MNCRMCNGKLKKIDKISDNFKILGRQFPNTPVYISSCTCCGLVQYNSDISQDMLYEYYSSDNCVSFQYIKNYGKEKSEDYFSHIYQEICTFIDKDSFILDVGGAWGEFANYLIQKGFNNVWVADPDPKCVEYINNNGGKAVCVSSSELTNKIDKKFDLIMFNHVLEHVLDINETIIQSKQLLSENGVLYVEVPNIEGYSSHELDPFYYLTYEHVLHFTNNDLKNLSKKHELEIIHTNEYYKEISQYPCTMVAYRKKSIGVKGCAFSNKGEIAIREYIKNSKEKLKELTEKYKETQEKMILWGIGASTSILIQGFEGCNVVQLIDKNKQKQGLIFNINGKELEIEDPKNIQSNATIVILPYMYKNAIQQDINNMKLTNKIVGLK